MKFVWRLTDNETNHGNEEASFYNLTPACKSVKSISKSKSLASIDDTNKGLDGETARWFRSHKQG